MLTIPVQEFSEYSNNHAKNYLFSMARGYVDISEPTLIQADSFYPKDSETELCQIFNRDGDASRKVHVVKGCIRTRVSDISTNSEIEIRQESYLVCEEKSKSSYRVTIVLPSFVPESDKALIVPFSVSILDLGTRGKSLEYYAEKIKNSYYKMICPVYSALAEDLKTLGEQVDTASLDRKVIERLEPLFKKALCGNNERAKWSAKKATRQDTQALYNNTVRGLVQAEIGLKVTLPKRTTDMQLLKRQRENPEHFESFLGKEATQIFDQLIANEICVSYMERLTAREVDIIWNLVAAKQFLENGKVLHGFSLNRDWLVAERPALMALCGYDSNSKRQIKSFTDMLSRMSRVEFQHIAFHSKKKRNEDIRNLVKKQSLKMHNPFGLAESKSESGCYCFEFAGLSKYTGDICERGYEDFNLSPTKYIVQHTVADRSERLVDIVGDIVLLVRRRPQGYTVSKSAFDLRRGRTSKDISDFELVKRALWTTGIAIIVDDEKDMFTFKQLENPELHRFSAEQGSELVEQ